MPIAVDCCHPVKQLLQGNGLRRATALVTSTALVAATAASAATAAPATYEIKANTISGMGAGASGMEMMRMLMGGGQSATSRNLDLTLTSSQRPPAAPQAVHQIPSGLGMGTSLPLLTPPPPSVSRDKPADDNLPEFKGRLVIFRGCEGSAAAEQPEVIELAGLKPDQRHLAQLMANRKGWNSEESTNNVTKGTWPSGEKDKQVPAKASLVGDHLIQSNYAPEIRFQVGSGHDFLAPVQLSMRRAGEAMDLNWKSVPTALGSQAMAIGSKESGNELVIWTSSATPWGDSAVPAALDPAMARKLISKGTLMPPEQIRCTIGGAAMKRIGNGVVTLTAYGEALRAVGQPPLWTMTLVRDSVSTMPLIEMDLGNEEQPSQEAPKKRGGWGLIPGLF